MGYYERVLDRLYEEQAAWEELEERRLAAAEAEEQAQYEAKERQRQAQERVDLLEYYHSTAEGAAL